VKSQNDSPLLATEEKAQKLGVQQQEAVARANAARVAQQQASDQEVTAVATAKTSQEKAAKSAAANAALASKVDSLTKKTDAINVALKSKAAQEVNDAGQASGTAQTADQAEEKASLASNAAMNADESAAKAVEARNLAQARLKKAQNRETEASNAAGAAANQASANLKTMKTTEATLQSLGQDLQIVQGEKDQAKAAFDAAESQLAKANEDAAQGGDKVMIELETRLNGMDSSNFEAQEKIAFRETVASILGVAPTKVLVTDVKGSDPLLIKYVIWTKDLAGGTDLKRTMVTINPEDLTSSFRERLSHSGMSIPAPAVFNATDGTVAESMTQAQHRAEAVVVAARKALDNVTSIASAVAVNADAANEKASEASKEYLNAKSDTEAAAAAKKTATDEVIDAKAQADTTGEVAASKLKKQGELDAGAKQAEADATAATAAAARAKAAERAIDAKLKDDQTDQESLGIQLDRDASKRASADVIATRQEAIAEDEAAEAKKLATEKATADNKAAEAISAEEAINGQAQAAKDKVQTETKKLAQLQAADAAAKAAVQHAVQRNEDTKEEAAKESKVKDAEKKADAAEFRKEEEKRSDEALDGATEYKIEVSNKLTGVKADEFTDDLKTAFKASVAVSLGMDVNAVAIESVSDVGPEDMMKELAEGVSSGAAGIDVKYSIATTSKDKAEMGKRAVAAVDPKSLTDTFKAEAATMGVAVPAGVEAEAPQPGEVEVEKTNTKVAELEAATEALKAQKAELELADAQVKKNKKRYEASEEKLSSATKTFKENEEIALDLEARAKEKNEKLKAQAEEKRKTEDALTAKTTELKLAEESKALAEAAVQKADVKQQLAATAADATWSEFIKGDADRKTEEASAKGAPIVLDSWNEALAKVVQESGSCSNVAQKFKTIIVEARNQTMHEAQQKCVSSNSTWTDFESRVNSEVAKRTAKLTAQAQRLTTRTNTESMLDRAKDVSEVVQL